MDQHLDLHHESENQEEQPLQFENELVEENVGNEKQLSKKQMKKLARKQKWQEQKKQKRQEEKQKKKEKKKLLREQKQSQPQAETEKKQLQWKEQPQQRKRKQDYQEKMNIGLPVVIDLQFYDQMTYKQKLSLIKQLSYCHSINRKMKKCFNYFLTSLTKDIFKDFAAKYNLENWGIKLKEQHLLDLFPHERLVYLTGDAEEELREFDPECVYIVGGIVDHNRLKNITIDYAKEHKIKAFRLPMQGLKLRASVHLAVNHVWEWMLWFYNGSTWKQAIEKVIPERKLHKPEIQENLI